jgi:uncharacterized membrane protein
MRSLAISLILLSAVAFGVHGKPVAAKPDFAKDVKPVLVKYCVKCHAGPTAADQVDLQKIRTEADAKKALKVIKKCLSEMNKNAMPPQGNAKPTAEKVKAFGAWVKAQK